MLKFALFVGLCLSISLAEVVELTDSTFDTTLGANNWIVKFYAPWCGHCKTLRPIFDDLSNVVSGDVKVGAVDTTRNPGLTKRFEIKRFPTILYKKDDVIGNYDGPRKIEGLTSFCNRMSDSSFVAIKDLHDLGTLYSKTENVVFLFTFKSTEQSSESMQALDNFKSVAIVLQSHASFAIFDLQSQPVSTDMAPLISSAGFTIAKMELGREPALMTINSLDTVSLVDQLSSFVESNNYPSINEFDNHNFKRLSHLNKTMVVAIVDHRDQAEADTFIDALRNTVHSFPVEVTSNYVFGHLDGNRWRRFIKEHDAVLSSVLVVDTKHDLHHSFPIDPDARNSMVSVGVAIADVISSLVAGKVEMHPTVPPGLLQKIQYRIRDYAPWSYLVLSMPFALLLLSIFVSYPPEEKMKKQ